MLFRSRRESAENCFSLTKMVLDGETRTILNETFPFNGFIDDFTDLPCDEPIPEEVRAWYYERYTGEFADASYGNEELANFQYANIVPESSGPVVLELLAQDSCYWFDKDKSIRNPWDKNTTMTLHPEVDPLPGSVVGIIEGEERDQLIVGKSAVLGAGAMGCLFGGLLAEKGLNVNLIDVWKEHVDAINKDGLKMDGHGGDRIIKVKATSDPSSLDKMDAVIVMCKATALEPALNSIKNIIGEKTIFMSFQNGIGHEAIIQSIRWAKIGRASCRERV